MDAATQAEARAVADLEVELVETRSALDGVGAEAGRIEFELRELIARHEKAAVETYGPGTGGFHVAIAELRNVLEPGSAPMYPHDQGHTATCGTCMPNGDGVARWGQRKRTT